MLYTGIDQSYRNSGIVIVDDKGSVVKFEVVQTLKEDGDYFTRAKIASESIVNTVKTVSEYSEGVIEDVGLEGLAFSLKGMTLQNLAGLQWMIVNGLRDEGFHTPVFTPSTVKKFATGSGKAKKGDMWEALPEKVKKRFEQVSKSNGREDLADAYWIAMKTKHLMEE